MEEKAEGRSEALRVSVDPVVVTIVSEPFVVFTRRGYAPVVNVEAAGSPEKKILYISSSSLAAALDPMVEQNGGKFLGLKFSVKKESTDKFAKYIVESVQ